jgi:hypothetical protein
MQKEDYSIIIFDGYFDNKEFYSEHIEREFTKAIELHNIKPFEFFTRCLNLVDEKIKESVDNYNGLIKELKDRVNENYSEDSVNYASKRLIEVKDQIHYYLNSSQPFVEGGVRYLTLDEFNLIKIEIQNRLNHANNNSNISESTSKKYNNIFVANNFEFFDRLLKEFNITEQSRADLKFIFEMFKLDGLIHKNITQNFFYDSINQIYNSNYQTTSNWIKSDLRLSIYNNVKENF